MRNDTVRLDMARLRMQELAKLALRRSFCLFEPTRKTTWTALALAQADGPRNVYLHMHFPRHSGARKMTKR